MKIKASLVIVIIFSFFFQGCIVFEKVSYDIKLKTQNTGTATITFYNLKSDAIGKKEFEEDKEALFNYLLKSEEFVEQMKLENKNISSRKLFLSADKLNGEVVYGFDNINHVENILYQDGFYFLTVNPTDSIISTNGVVMTSGEFKRIVWDSSFRNLKFEMLSDIKQINLRELAPFYKEN